MEDHIIISPHADDEIIGTYEILTDSKIKPIIIYTERMLDKRKQETLKLRDHVNIKIQLYLYSVPPNLLNLNLNNTFYFPHPIYETHPSHRAQGFVGEQLARQGFNVIFYITEMNAPFKYECKNSDKKKELLELVYPSQSDLWKYENKYFLFSGYDKFIYL